MTRGLEENSFTRWTYKGQSPIAGVLLAELNMIYTTNFFQRDCSNSICYTLPHGYKYRLSKMTDTAGTFNLKQACSSVFWQFLYLGKGRTSPQLLLPASVQLKVDDNLTVTALLLLVSILHSF